MGGYRWPGSEPPARWLPFSFCTMNCVPSNNLCCTDQWDKEQILGDPVGLDPAVPFGEVTGSHRQGNEDCSPSVGL